MKDPEFYEQRYKVKSYYVHADYYAKNLCDMVFSKKPDLIKYLKISEAT